MTTRGLANSLGLSFCFYRWVELMCRKSLLLQFGPNPFFVPFLPVFIALPCGHSSSTEIANHTAGIRGRYSESARQLAYFCTIHITTRLPNYPEIYLWETKAYAAFCISKIHIYTYLDSWKCFNLFFSVHSYSSFRL